MSLLKSLPFLVGLLSLSLLFSCAPITPSPGPSRAIFSPKTSISRTLPEEMAPLSRVKVLTRAGLAVLLMMELPTETFKRESKTPIVVDVSDHWARAEVLYSVQFGLMPVSANHRFQPDRPITKGDMAEVLARILRQEGKGVRRRPISSGLPTDLPEDHLYSPSVRHVLEAGLMDLDSAGRFDVASEVTGLQALGFINNIKTILE